MGVLYHISMDDKHKSLFTYTPAIGMIYEMLMRTEDLRREPELIALTVNLTQNVRCATALCEGQRFDRLLKRALATGDDLLFKVMRNCSQVCYLRHAVELFAHERSSTAMPANHMALWVTVGHVLGACRCHHLGGHLTRCKIPEGPFTCSGY